MHVAAVLRPAVRPVVAHVHHGLQPHADDWLQFCADEARALGLRFLARRLDPATRPPLQRPGSLSGLEAWAREGRYRALADMAAAVGARVVITAHHANDQLETVEMRRRRGSGVLGLAGMREQAPLPHAPVGYRLLRPFLSLSRAQLARWAETHGLQWVEDPSNQDLRFTRNRIRDALDRQLQDEPEALPGGLAAVGLFQQAADRLLAQAAADVAAATVHVTPRAGRRTGLPAGVPQGLLVAAAPVQATPPDSSLDLTMLLDAPLTVDLASAEAKSTVNGASSSIVRSRLLSGGVACTGAAATSSPWGTPAGRPVRRPARGVTWTVAAATSAAACASSRSAACWNRPTAASPPGRASGSSCSWRSSASRMRLRVKRRSWLDGSSTHCSPCVSAQRASCARDRDRKGRSSRYPTGAWGSGACSRMPASPSTPLPRRRRISTVSS